MTSSPWEALGVEFPVSERLVYLDHAAVSPIPRRSAEAIARIAQEQCEHGATAYDAWLGGIARARADVARLLGADADEVAFVKNTTHGLIIAAESIPWQEGDNVVIPACEFPANVHPWLTLERRRGVQVRMVAAREGRVLLDDLAAACDRRTRAISVSWVQFGSGYRIDPAAVAQLCKDLGAYCVVDGIQGVGAIPCDVHAWGVDFLSADGHKWMLGPEGCGALYVRRDILDGLAPANLGWLSMRNAGDFVNHTWAPRPDARRFEEGSPNVIGIHGLGASVGLLLELGIEPIWERIRELTDHLIEGLRGRGCEVLSPLGEGERSGIVTFGCPTLGLDECVRRLRADGVIVSLRGGGVRVSPHCYSSEEGLQRLVEAL